MSPFDGLFFSFVPNLICYILLLLLPYLDLMQKKEGEKESRGEGLATGLTTTLALGAMVALGLGLPRSKKKLRAGATGLTAGLTATSR